MKDVTVSEALQRLHLTALPKDKKIAEERLESLLTGSGVGEMPSLFEAYYIIEHELKNKNLAPRPAEPAPKDMSLSDMYAEIAAERENRASQANISAIQVEALAIPANLPFQDAGNTVAPQVSSMSVPVATLEPEANQNIFSDEFTSEQNFEAAPSAIIGNGFTPMQHNPFPRHESKQPTPAPDGTTVTNFSAKNSIPESVPNWSGEEDDDHDDLTASQIVAMRQEHKPITVEFLIDMPELLRSEAKRPLFGRNPGATQNESAVQDPKLDSIVKTSGLAQSNILKLAKLPMNWLLAGAAAAVVAIWFGIQALMFTNIQQIASTKQSNEQVNQQTNTIVASLKTSRSTFNHKLFELWQQSGAKLRYATWENVPVGLHELELEKFEAAVRLKAP